MIGRDWTLTSDTLPEAGLVVEAMDSRGEVQELKRDGVLWFVPDGSYYVHFTPTMWKHKNEQ